MDFQTVLVFLIILAAVGFVGRHVFSRLHSFSVNAKDGCETGCGKCGTANEARTIKHS